MIPGKILTFLEDEGTIAISGTRDADRGYLPSQVLQETKLYQVRTY